MLKPKPNDQPACTPPKSMLVENGEYLHRSSPEKRAKQSATMKAKARKEAKPTETCTELIERLAPAVVADLTLRKAKFSEEQLEHIRADKAEGLSEYQTKEHWPFDSVPTLDEIRAARG